MEFDRSLFIATLTHGLGKWGLAHLEPKVEEMLIFAELIIETNKSLNLTRIVDPKEMAGKNFLDSLSLLKMHWPETMHVLDLGTGAGFPGVPLALARPNWTVVLLDSLKKRLTFLDAASKSLGLTNIRTVHARGEDAGQSEEHREMYNLVVSRAVANLPVLLELCAPLVKVDGYFVAYKSGEVGVEINKSAKALEELKMSLEQTFPLDLPFELGERTLLLFKKMGPTPSKYPRRAGLPNRRPLE